MKKNNLKLALDIFMILALPLLMAYSLIGERFHEILGTAMGCVFIAHNILNRAFYKNVFRGKYNALRAMMLVLNAALLIDILLLMASGIILSTFVFSFVNFDSVYMASRLIHLCASYWGFLLMSFHAGLHIPVAKIFRKLSKAAKINLVAVVILICIFGICCFVKNNFFQYLFLRTHFVFLDFEKPRILFFAEYISVMILFMTVGAFLRKVYIH